MISLKLAVMIGPTNANVKNRLTLDGDPVLDTDFRSLFHFPQLCRIGRFRSIISISHYSNLSTADHLRYRPRLRVL